MKKERSILEIKYKSAYSAYRKFNKLVKTNDSRLKNVIKDVLSGALNDLAYLGIGINQDGEMFRSTFDYLITYTVDNQTKRCVLHRITHTHLLDFSHRLKEHYHATKILATELETNHRYYLGGYENE